MVEADPLRWLRVDADPEAVHDVRVFVQSCCEDWDLPATSDVAVLLASELATNAVRYARTPLTVWLGHRSDRLVLSVEDASPSLATARTPDVWAEGGRGLQLVDALADRWGEREVSGGKLVWAEIATRPVGAQRSRLAEAAPSGAGAG